jgi:hypothetical protein
MKKTPLDPDVADVAPTDSMLTLYDEEHIITYLRLLDADAVGADWQKVTQIVLHLDPAREPGPRAARIRQSSRPRQMDDRARLQASDARRRIEFELIAAWLPFRVSRRLIAREKWRIRRSAATATRRRRDRLKGHPQEREHSDAAGGTRDRVPPARRSLSLARGIVTRRAETNRLGERSE